MKRFFLSILTALITGTVSFAFPGEGTIRWNAELVPVSGNEFEVVLTGNILDGWHTYPYGDEVGMTSIDFSLPEGAVLVGTPSEEGGFTDYKGENVIEGEHVIRQRISFSGDHKVSGIITWQSCKGDECHMPEEWEFDIKDEITATSASSAISTSTVSEKQSSTGMWRLILEAILWGFAMLLTPCVFPMVPMTVSFFLKGSEDKKKGKAKALAYGAFIVLLYTVPICAIIGITWLIGGESVTADIFNWLSTHWLPNILFFAVFMAFAASFFGAFEITLPSKWTNKADKNSDRKGLLGVFFIALTLVLVSFSCTGPIVGTVLIKSTEGEFWTPMVTMLAFSIAFALPFTILALFPALLKSLPKSGGWLNSVKVVLGFVEIALGFKFLSTADQTYHWGILDREVYLAIWIVCFTLLGFYLLGKLRFKNDEPLEYISVKRLALAIAAFSFVVYLIPGMWGAPLKALSGYLPPMETQDFISGAYSTSGANAGGPTLTIAQGLKAYDNIEDALEAGRMAGKPVFVDISGHGCVNCREMEARVWSDSRVRKILDEEYILVTLYTDDKTKLPESKWITTDNGKVLKDVGRVNSYIVREKFNVNAQPNYALLDPQTGGLLAPVRGYNLNIEEYIKFLESGL